MKKIIGSFLLLLFAGTFSLVAQSGYLRGAKLASAKCSGTGDYGLVYSVTDATSAVDVSATGTAQAVAVCGSGGLVTFVPASVAATITLTSSGSGSDVVLVAADDVILSPSDDLTLNATDDTTIAGDNLGITTTTVTLNPGGSTVELQMAAGTSTFLGSLILPIGTAPPAACAAGTKGTIYYDSDINKLCVCNATNYVLVDDASTTTGCS